MSWHARAMRTHVWLLAPVFLLAGACEEKPAPKPAEPPPAVSSASAPVESPAPPPVGDTDVAHLQQQLKCPNKATKDACDVLDGFAKGKKWDLTTIQGKQARYFGKAIESKGGELHESWVFLVVERIPLNEAAKGDLPLKVALREVDKSDEAANNHAEKLLRLLERDDAFNKRNQTANHVLEYVPSNWDSAAKTDGTSTILHIGSGTFVRQGEGRSLYLVRVDPAKPGASSTDGVFVRMFPMSW